MGLIDDISAAVARMTNEGDMKGGAARGRASKRAVSKPKTSASKTRSKSKAQSPVATKPKARSPVAKKPNARSPVAKKSKTRSSGPVFKKCVESCFGGKKSKSKSKRAPSAYNLFVQKEMGPYRAKHPNASQKEALSGVAKMWNTHKKK